MTDLERARQRTDCWKIMYIITRMAEFTGAALHVRDMAVEMQARGHAAVIVCGCKGAAAEAAEALGIEVVEVAHLVSEIRPVRDVRALRRLARLIRERQPDMVSAHSFKAGVIGRMAAMNAKVPAIFTAHGWSFTNGVHDAKRPLYASIERGMASFAYRIITASTNDQELAYVFGVGKPEQLVAVHAGIPDIELPTRVARAPGEPTRLAMVARFDEQKDHALLLEALAALGREDWTLSLAGSGDASAVRRRADSLGIAERVAFCGELYDIPGFLARQDMFLLVSQWEGFPRSTLEAMRSGLPAVVSDVGGAGEAVLDGETGFVVARDARAELTASIERLLDDPDLCRKMGVVARDRFEAHFRFGRMAEATIRHYRAAIGDQTS